MSHFWLSRGISFTGGGSGIDCRNAYTPVSSTSGITLARQLMNSFSVLS